MKEFNSPIEETQSIIIFKLKSKITELERENKKIKQDKAKLVGILVGVFFAFGDKSAGLLRIKKKHMMKANPAWSLFPEIEHRTKDLIVRFLDPVAARGGNQCQSTTIDAKDVENNSKCGTNDSTTSLKSVPDAEPPPDESSTPNNT